MSWRSRRSRSGPSPPAIMRRAPLHLEHFGCPKLNCYEAYQDMGRICETRGELEEALGYYEEAWDCGKLDEDKETVERLRKMVEGRE